MNRSASAVLAYMMKHLGYRLQAAIDKVTESRGIFPLSNFLSALIDYEATIYPKAKQAWGKDSLELQDPTDYTYSIFDVPK